MRIRVKFVNELSGLAYLKMFVGDSWIHNERGVVCRFESHDFYG